MARSAKVSASSTRATCSCRWKWTLFEPGQVVGVTHGPFNDFNGVVETVNYEKSRLQVAVQILGRSTPVELDFSQVEKA